MRFGKLCAGVTLVFCNLIASKAYAETIKAFVISDIEVKNAGSVMFSTEDNCYLLGEVTGQVAKMSSKVCVKENGQEQETKVDLTAGIKESKLKAGESIIFRSDDEGAEKVTPKKRSKKK